MSILDTIRGLLGNTGTNNISREVMKQMLLSGDTYTIHGKKLSGTRIKRTAFATVGPTGNMAYDYSALGYMALFSETDNEYRMFVLRNITKIVDEQNVTYFIK